MDTERSGYRERDQWRSEAADCSEEEGLSTFVTAAHAHPAAVGAHVTLHPLHSRLAGAQARHLLTVISHRAHRVTVTRCRRAGREREGERVGREREGERVGRAREGERVGRERVCGEIGREAGRERV